MWLAVVLFVLLSPGVLITLPSFGLFSQQTSVVAVILHALVFAVLLELLRRYSLNDLVEGFTDSTLVDGWKLGDGCGSQICKAENPVCRQNSDGAKFCSEK